MRNLTLLLTITFLTGACSLRFPKDKTGSSAAEQFLQENSGKTPSFAVVRETVFRGNCIGCHAGTLDSHAGAAARAANIRNLVFATKTMPPNGELEAAEAEVLRRWLDAGAPDTVAGIEDPAPPPPTEPPPPADEGATFARVKREILAPKCLLCHAAGGRADDIPLSTAEEILSQADLVNLEKPEESNLLRATQGADDLAFMPPKRSNIPALTLAEQDLLRQWIAEGAKP